MKIRRSFLVAGAVVLFGRMKRAGLRAYPLDKRRQDGYTHPVRNAVLRTDARGAGYDRLRFQDTGRTLTT